VEFRSASIAGVLVAALVAGASPGGGAAESGADPGRPVRTENVSLQIFVSSLAYGEIEPCG
jgi:hypothetical protein